MHHVCMNGLAVVEALWRHTGILLELLSIPYKTYVAASYVYEEISCIPNHRLYLCMACNDKWLHEQLVGLY